jgi:PAS domain S-box-containing protein
MIPVPADDKSHETLRARLAALEELLDVYEHTAAEQARKLELALAQLRTADDRFRSLVQNSSDVITVVDRDSRITYQSPSVATVLGYPPDSLQGTDWYDLVHPDDAPGLHLSEVMAAHEPSGTSGEARLRHADGSWRDTEIRTQDLLQDPGIAGVVLNVRDISERKKAEAAVAAARDEAVEASRAKSDFLAVMSHEIRTPMNGVIGLTGLLLDSPLSETQRHYAEGVRASGEALLGIINDILDFSKIEAGKLELETVDFDLGQALDDVAELVAESARAKGLELVAYHRPAVPTALSGDVGRLRQILLNLATNAVKFTGAGEVVLRAGLTEEPTGAQVMVRFEVSDTGVGVDAGTAQRLFDPFSQADASTTRRYGGTGLGLAICRRLAEAMGGDIGLDSRPGEGSTFWVRLRFARATELPGRAPPVERSLTGRWALVIDDNETNRLVLTSQLQAWDITTDAAADAQAGLALMHRAAAEGHPYDVALVDMEMPGMDGLELARVVTADARLASTRLLLLASVPVEADAASGAGFAARLAKPVRLPQLYDALMRAVDPLAPAAPSWVVPLPAAAANTRGTLLVVEDNAVNQVVAKGILAKLSYRCDVAADGVEALAALERRSYDAVLMDCRMPNMDGFQATAEIRRREAGERHVPIIAMTASAQVADREMCIAAGMDDFVSKPMNGRQMEAVLSRWLPAVGNGLEDAGADVASGPADGDGVVDME